MSWKDAGWPYASRTALTLRFLEFCWRDEDEVLRTGSRVQAECKEAGWTATVHPMERKGLCGQIRNPTSHAAGMTEKSSQRAIKATGCGYGGGTVLSLQHIFRGSCRGWQGDVPTGRCTAWGSKHQSAVVPADDLQLTQCAQAEVQQAKVPSRKNITVTTHRTPFFKKIFPHLVFVVV